MAFCVETGLTVRPEHAEEFFKMLPQAIEKASQQKGFISFRATSIVEAEGKFLAFSRWETMEDMDNWFKNEFHQGLIKLGQNRFFANYCLRKYREL